MPLFIFIIKSGNHVSEVAANANALMLLCVHAVRSTDTG
jgi:hypothetical protein